MPQGRDQSEPLLPLVEGVPGGGQETLAGDTAREATSDEVKELKAEARQLKEVRRTPAPNSLLLGGIGAQSATETIRVGDLPGDAERPTAWLG